MLRRLPHVVALFAVFALAEAATAQQPASSDAVRQQYAAAVALQNRELYETAALEWEAFLKRFAADPLAPCAQHYLGVCRYQNKEYPAAEQAFQKVLDNYPKFEFLDGAYLYQGLTQYQLGQSGKAPSYDAALKTLAAGVSQFPKGKYLAQMLYYQGECYFAQNMLAEAAKQYAELVRQTPESSLVPDALYNQGVAEQTQEHFPQADALFATFIQRFPKHRLATEVGMRRGTCLLAAGNHAEAEKLLAAAAATPNFPLADQAHVQQADCVAEQKRYPEAAALYASLPQKFPNSQSIPAAQLAAGRCYYLAGQYDAARKGLAAVVARGGEPAAEAAHWIARSFLKEKKPAEALAAVEQAQPGKVTGPFTVQLLMDRADSLYELPPRRSEAAEAYKLVATKHPNDSLAADALYMAAFTSLGLADYAAAQSQAADFVKRFPQHKLFPNVKYIAAESQLLLKEYAAAEAAYRDLLKNFPQHADAPQWALRLPLALHLQKKHAETIAAGGDALKVVKTPSARAEAQHLIGSSHSELKRYQPAVDALEAALKADDHWAQADETLLVLGYAYRQLNKLDAARDATQKIVDQFRNSRLLDQAHYRLGEYAYAAGDFAAAATAYQQVLDKFPTSELAQHAIYGLGWANLSQGKHEQAEASLSQLIEKFPESTRIPKARYARGMARQQLKKHAEAVADLQAFLATNPDRTEKSDACYVLGLCQVGLDQKAEAVKTFTTLLEEDANYAGGDKVLYELAWAHKDLGQEAEAAERFAALSEKFADSPLAAESQYHAGEFAYGEGEFKKASMAYFSAMNKAGKTDLGEKATHKLAWTYYRQEDFPKAEQTFNYQRVTWPQGPLSADAAFMEGESLFKQDKFDKALAAYELVKNPSSDDFQVLTLLHGGQAAGKLKQWDKSLALLERAARDYPMSEYLPEVLYEQGWARQSQGQPDEALPLYEMVTEKTGREVAARARFMIGEIYFEKKDHQEAVRNFFKVAYAYSYPEWQANAHYEAARCFEVLKKPDQAKKSYQEIVEKFPTSDKVEPAKKRLAELGT